MKIYKGLRAESVTEVTVDNVPLDPRCDLRELSANGFEWGYKGSGPYQLALAILADHFQDDAKALDCYRSLCEGVIAAIREDAWTLTSREIAAAMDGVVEVDMTLEELLNKVRGG